MKNNIINKIIAILKIIFGIFSAMLSFIFVIVAITIGEFNFYLLFLFVYFGIVAFLLLYKKTDKIISSATQNNEEVVSVAISQENSQEPLNIEEQNAVDNKNIKASPINSLSNSKISEIVKQEDNENIFVLEQTSKPLISATIKSTKTPQQTLNSMRSTFTMIQASENFRIIEDSLKIMQETSNIDTFLSRFETAMRSALTLEQAKEAGIPIELEDGFSQLLMKLKEEGLIRVLYRSYQKEINEIDKLKTNAGKLNRINKYQQKLKDLYEDEFEFRAEDAYNDVMQKLENLKNQLS